MSASSDNDNSSRPSKPSGASVSSRTIRVIGNHINVHDLFVGTREITILHDGRIYRMRITQQNKLILTK